jgi:hypothetical protein
MRACNDLDRACWSRWDNVRVQTLSRPWQYNEWQPWDLRLEQNHNPGRNVLYDETSFIGFWKFFPG